MRVPFCLFVICLCLLSVNAVPRGPIKMKNPRSGKSNQQNCQTIKLRINIHVL